MKEILTRENWQTVALSELEKLRSVLPTLCVVVRSDVAALTVIITYRQIAKNIVEYARNGQIAEAHGMESRTARVILTYWPSFREEREDRLREERANFTKKEYQNHLDAVRRATGNPSALAFDDYLYGPSGVLYHTLSWPVLRVEDSQISNAVFLGRKDIDGFATQFWEILLEEMFKAGLVCKNSLNGRTFLDEDGTPIKRKRQKKKKVS
jgi:hypothetical protein